MRVLQESDEDKYKTQFSRYIKAGVGADDLEGVYTKAHAAIRESPVFEKKAAKENPNRDHKKYSAPRRSYAARKNRVKQILAARERA
jgi:large subunit ribosomal protein L5e